jgi:capsular polysaccharide biosynthesis protein
MIGPDEPPERGLRDHLGVLRRRWSLLVGVVALFVVLAVAFSLRQPTRYRATAEVLFRQEPFTVETGVDDQLVPQQRLDPERVIQNETRLAASEPVRERVRAELGDPVSISASNVRDSDVIRITATAADAERAARMADTAAAAYTELRRRQVERDFTSGLAAIDQRLDDIDRRVEELDTALATDPPGPEAAALTAEREVLLDQRAEWQRERRRVEAEAAVRALDQVQVLEPATVPSSPVQPATVRNAVLAAVVGLVVALLLAYATDRLDDRVRRPEDLESLTGIPVLGTVPSGGGTGMTSVGLDDRRLDGLDGPLPAEVAAGGPARVLVVPVGTRASRVRQAAATLDRLGLVVVGAVLTPAEDLAAPEEPSRHGGPGQATRTVGTRPGPAAPA